MRAQPHSVGLVLTEASENCTTRRAVLTRGRPSLYPGGMDTFEVDKELSGGRAIVKGEFRYLYPGDRIYVTKGDKKWAAVVLTRVTGGALVKVILGA